MIFFRRPAHRRAGPCRRAERQIGVWHIGFTVAADGMLLPAVLCCASVLHAVPAYCLSFDTRLMSFDLHSFSTLQSPDQSPESSGLMYVTL